MTKEKYGFIYLWRDRKHNRYYIGSHWGTIEDGYVCSSKWMRDAYYYRPKDFKRRIIKVIADREKLLEEEQRWLNMIKPEEKRIRYYNLSLLVKDPWWHNPERAKTTRERISQKTKEAMARPDVKENNLKEHWANNKKKRKSVSEKLRYKKTDEHKEKLRQANLGKKLSEETKRKISKNHNRDYNCPIFRDKLRYTKSPEHREKLRQAHLSKKVI